MIHFPAVVCTSSPSTMTRLLRADDGVRSRERQSACRVSSSKGADWMPPRTDSNLTSKVKSSTAMTLASSPW